MNPWKHIGFYQPVPTLSYMEIIRREIFHRPLDGMIKKRKKLKVANTKSEGNWAASLSRRRIRAIINSNCWLTIYWYSLMNLLKIWYWERGPKKSYPLFELKMKKLTLREIDAFKSVRVIFAFTSLIHWSNLKSHRNLSQRQIHLREI